MKKSNIIPKLDINKVQVEIDNYKFALYAIVVLEKIFNEISNAESFQGKKLLTSDNNTISKNEEITPDLVIEVPTNKFPDYKALNEIKASFPQDEEQWFEPAKQLKKYDDELSCWTYSTSYKHDIMLTTDITFTQKFKKYLEKLSYENKIKIERNIAILEFIHRDRATAQLFIRKFSGEISHEQLDEVLSEGKTIHMYNILNELEKTKFYDAHPPEIYTMMIMWDHVFPKFINSRAKFRDLEQNRNVEIEIKIEQIINSLSKFAPDSNPNCIKKSWIEEALLWFQELGIVTPPKEGEKFTIKYKKRKEETYDWILDKVKHNLKDNNDGKIVAKTTKSQQLDGFIWRTNELSKLRLLKSEI